MVPAVVLIQYRPEVRLRDSRVRVTRMTRRLACQKDNELRKTMVTRLTRRTLTRVSSRVTRLYFHLGSCYSASVDTFMFCLPLICPSQSERV